MVSPEFDRFRDQESGSFPMKLMIPEVVVGELLFQQTSSALKALGKANEEIKRVKSSTKKDLRRDYFAKMGLWTS